MSSFFSTHSPVHALVMASCICGRRSNVSWLCQYAILDVRHDYGSDICKYNWRALEGVNASFFSFFFLLFLFLFLFFLIFVSASPREVRMSDKQMSRCGRKSLSAMS